MDNEGWFSNNKQEFLCLSMFAWFVDKTIFMEADELSSSTTESQEFKQKMFLSFQCKKSKVRTANRPSFLFTIDAERKDKRTTNRPFIFSAINAKRKDG